jgi:hypothetical protein
MSMNNVTFLVPVFNLEGDRLNNFKYVVSKLRETHKPILVIEQLPMDTESSIISDFCRALGVRHHKVEIDSEDIHKSFLINEGTRQINTEYVWMNDADCIMNFDAVLNTKFSSDFIQPYKIAKRLTKRETITILSNNNVDVEFKSDNDQSDSNYISMPSALSFIYKKHSFFEIGGMDERFIGWGYEDNEFSTRLLSIVPNVSFEIFTFYAIHLWHKSANSSDKSIFNKLIFENSFTNDNIEHSRNKNKSLLTQKSCNILTLFRGDFGYLNNIDTYLSTESELLPNTKITWILNTENDAFINEAKIRSHKYNDIRLIINSKNPSPELTNNYWDHRHEYVTDIYRRVVPTISDDFIFTLEDDMIPPNKTLVKLFYKMIEDPEKTGAVAAIYDTRIDDGLSCCITKGCNFRLPTNFIKNNGFLEGNRTGGGATLWNNNILKSIAPIQFTRIDETTVDGWDWSLSRKILELDCKIFLDTDSVCKHLTK